MALNEDNYKELRAGVDPTFIHHAEHVKEVKDIRMTGLENENRVMKFDAPSCTTPGLVYHDRIEFLDYDKFANDFSMNKQARARAIIGGEIRVHCACKSFLYWGYKYIDTTIDAAIEKEGRAPDIRNPQRRGTLCKHLDGILRVLPFYAAEYSRFMPDKGSGGPQVVRKGGLG